MPSVLDAPYPAGPAPLPCTGGRLRRLTRRVTVFYEHYLRSVGLKLSQYSILVHLGATPRSLMELAERLEMDRTTLTRGLRLMARNGWVRESRGRDARQHLFALTAEGDALRGRAQVAWAEAQCALETVLDRGFVEQLNARLEDALDRIRPALPEEN